MTPAEPPPAAGVCVVGSLNVDTTYRVPALPSHGETTLATARRTLPGGKGANQAAAAASQGSAVYMVGAVGDDDNADLCLTDLRERGVEVTGVQRLPQTATGTAVVVVDETGENLIVVDPAANARLDPRWVADAVSARPHAVVLAQLEVPVDALEAAAAAHGGLFLLNPAPAPEPATLAALLRDVDVLVPNRHELGRLARGPAPVSLDDVASCVATIGFTGTVVVTLGEDGAAVVDGSGRVLDVVPAPTVAVVDTSGAGDVFCGVLAHELGRASADLAGAVRRAVSLAAESTRHAGARLPSGVGAERVR